MNKTLIALLAIFLVAMSACAVSAQEITDVISEGEGPGDDPTFLDAPNTADGTADNKDTADDATGDDTAGDDEGGEDIAVDMPLTDGGNEDIASNEDDSG
ncbi:MAG: hypothetical protein IKS93_00790, partial [Methanobrevibacter sp.]|nr:hypothetical protein [Methanobrevibacter sp.]